MPNTPSNPPPGQAAIRAWFFGAMFLVVAAAVAVLISFRENKQSLPSAQRPVESGGLGQTSVPAASPVPVQPAPVQESLQPAYEASDPATAVVEQILSLEFDTLQSKPLKSFIPKL